MYKKIFAVLSLTILFALIPSALPAASAADGAASGQIQIEDRVYEDGTLSFVVRIPESGPEGSVAASLFDGSGREKGTVIDPAAETVQIVLEGVSETDHVKVVWLDGQLRPLDMTILRMSGSGRAEYEKFTEELREALEEFGGIAGGESGGDDPYALGRLIVRCDGPLPDMSGYDIAVTVPGPDGIYVLQFRSAAQARACAEYLQGLPTVRYAEPDTVIRADDAEGADASSTTPYSWGAEAAGLTAYAGNLLERGISGAVTVAVVDSGVDTDHPFLRGRLIAGYDYIEHDEIPQDEHGHGTHVAGTVVDCTPGMDVRIMPVRVLDAGGSGPLLTVSMGIRYAADHGADIIGLSLGSPTHSRYIDEAVAYAVSKNITVVAAAGNKDMDTASYCPAHILDCITVAAVDRDWSRFPLSNHGAAVDIAAPGVGIVSSVPDGKYQEMSGTSMAAPHVEAAAALLMIERGIGQTPAQIARILQDAAVGSSGISAAGRDDYLGAGILDLSALIIRPRQAVRFDANGGTGTMTPQSVVSGEATALRANAFTREGHQFTGWNTRSDGSGDAYPDRAMVTTDRALTLYAQWEPLSGIFALLYTDGELVFQTSRTAAPGRTIQQTYQVPGSDRSGADYAAWYDQRVQIAKVTFAETIRPASTALWFYGCVNLRTIEGLDRLDTSAVTDMSQMFAGCSSLTALDLTAFDTSKVMAMRQMFFNCSSLRTIDASDRFVTTAVTSSVDMFTGCTSLVGGRGTTYSSSNADKTRARIDGGTSAPGYFTDPDAVSNDIYAVLYADGDLVFQNNDRRESGRTVTEVYEVKGPYSSSSSVPWHGWREDITTVTFTDKIRPTSTAFWFFALSKLTDIRNIHDLDTSNVTSMIGMFWQCRGLTEVDVSGFDTTNVTDMSEMFWGCNGLTKVDVSGFDTTNVTSMYGMFHWCSGLTELDVSSFVTKNVTRMDAMFEGCSGLTEVDVSGFDTTNVTDMAGMFWGCSGLTKLNVSSFNTSNVTNMPCMFDGCRGLTELDVSGFDTSNVISMAGMFEECNGLTSLDLSNFDTSHVKNMAARATSRGQYSSGMFQKCTKLETIYVSASFTTDQVGEYRDRMFEGCTSLVGGRGTTYDSEHTDVSYARIDGGTSAPGYFTAKSA